MYLSTVASAFLTVAAVSAQQPGGQINSPEALASPGTGKYGARYFEEPTLPKHTIYQPKVIPPGFKAPVFVWGNGGCIGVGTIMAPFLIQVASQGVVVIANGAPEKPGTSGSFASFGSAPKSSSKDLKDAIDWAEKAAKGNPAYAHIDMSRVAAAGQSCGGGEAYGVATDPRVTAIGIFNSGRMNSGNVASYKKPIFYFLGGPKDMAYNNGKGDYAKLDPSVPAWLGNWAPKGHGGTFNELNGGVYGVAASHWVNWILRGDKSAGAFFTGDGAKTAGWTEITSRNLDKLQLPPALK